MAVVHNVDEWHRQLTRTTAYIGAEKIIGIHSNPIKSSFLEQQVLIKINDAICYAIFDEPFLLVNISSVLCCSCESDTDVNLYSHI